MNQMDHHTPKRDDEKSLGWKHPYIWYIVLTAVLFAFLLLMGYWAIENEWLPSRGISR